jgi:benzoylformate decarboxylase
MTASTWIPTTLFARSPQAWMGSTLLVDEAITVSALVRRHLPRDEAGSFHHTIGGGLGRGIGAAIGLALARPERMVAAVVGGGSALFGVQGLWTAANLTVPAIFVLLNNREYRAVRSGLDALGDDALAHGHHSGWSLSEPVVDWGALATGFGVRSLHPVTEAEVAEAVAAAQRACESVRVEVPIAESARVDGGSDRHATTDE